MRERAGALVELVASPASRIIIRTSCRAACASAVNIARALVMESAASAARRAVRLARRADPRVHAVRADEDPGPRQVDRAVRHHQISEAIFLSNRIAVFSARPARIKDVIAVDLPPARRSR